MRLILVDYLRSLRERDELELLIRDLLRAMRWSVISSPQTGVKQNGVDLAAIGRDAKNGVKRLHLFVIKAGDIGRSDWQGSVQSIRPTMDEVLDSYVPSRIPAEHQRLPIRIVLVTGGCMKQEVGESWAGFTQKHETPRMRFSFWGGDELAEQIETCFLNERLFPEKCRSGFRKLLALAGDTHGLSPNFCTVAQEVLPREATLAVGIRGLRTLNLSLRLLYRWCQDIDNLNQALLCAESGVLLAWEWSRANGYLSRTAFQTEFGSLYETYASISNSYVRKIAPYCVVADGLSMISNLTEIDHHLWTYEVLGRVSLFGLSLFGVRSADADSGGEAPVNNVARFVAHILKNHGVVRSPARDDHVIEIAMALTLLLATDDTRTYAIHWLHEMVNRIWFAYKCLGRHYPVDTTSYDALLDTYYGEAADKLEHTRASTLIPVLAEFCMIYEQPEVYDTLRKMVSELLPHTGLQMWFPDDTTDGRLYIGDAGVGTGVSYTEIRLPDDLEGVRREIDATNVHVWDFQGLSCVKHGMRILAWMSSRHHRTPPIPQMWRSLIPAAVGAPSDEVSGRNPKKKPRTSRGKGRGRRGQ